MASNSAGKSIMLEGRIVWTNGDIFKGQNKTVFGTKTPQLDAQGNQVVEYGFGLAVPKTAVAEAWQVMHEEAFQIYPSRQLPPAFAMKYKDGDTSVDDKGVSYSAREGYAGHLVFSLTTRIPIKYFRHENGSNIMISDGIKCGDYVRVQVNIKAHGAIGQGKPGLYMNPLAVLFLGYGQPIVNAPSADSIFGNQAPAMPQGASATPIGPAANTWAQPEVPTYAPPQQAPQAPAQPFYGTLPPQFQPQQQAPAPYPQPGVAPGHSAPPGYAQPQQPQQPQSMPQFPQPGMPSLRK